MSPDPTPVPAGGSRPWLSVVVPAHNCAGHLADTIGLLARHPLAGDMEVIVVENGSHDETWAVARELATRGGPLAVSAIQSDKGLGLAYAAGIRAARGQHVLLTADDLPFGTSDIDQWTALPPTPVVLGSKAHPGSVVHRGPVRGLMSGTFRLLRLVLLGMRVRDCQGTVIAEAGWLKDVLPRMEETGYLFSTELVHIALRQGVRVVEVPVVLRPSGSGTRIRLSDVVEMATGLLRLRARHRLVHPPVAAPSTR